jgi:3-polyprenyl-4-hydroxybenzoate decarboxylase
VKAGRDVYIIANCCDSPLDPAISVEQRGLGDRMIIDATWPMEPEDRFPPRPEWNGQRYPLLALPDEESLTRVDDLWRKLSFPT